MSEEKPIKILVGSFMETYKMKDKYEQMSVVHSWPDIVGDMIANNTEKIYFRGEVLYVKLNSPALKTELFYHKLIILEKVIKFSGKNIVKDIVFR